MKTRLNSIRRPHGFTYMTVVVTMIVVGLMLAAYLKLVAVQNQLTMRSQVWNRSIPVLEAGIEEAIAHMNKNASPDTAGNFNPQLTADGWLLAADGGWYKQAPLGNDFYYVKISPWPSIGPNPASFPFIYSTGYVQQVSAFAFNRVTGPFVAASLLDQLVGQGRMSKRVVEASTTNVPTFTKGLVTKKTINFNGQNIFTDSYNSTNPAYSSNGRWDPTKARDQGDIASNDTIVNSVNIGNAVIKGSVAVGPNGTVAIGNGVVGDASFVSDPANTGKIQDGHFRDDMNVEFVDPTVPSGSSGWLGLPPSTTPTDFDANGDGVMERYQYVLPSGNYLVSGSETLNSTYLIMGNVQIRVDTDINLTGQDIIQLNTNATLRIYANCPSITVSGNGVVNPGLSTSLQILATPICTSISLGGNSEFCGTIDAPNADLVLNGSGNSQNDFSGAAKVKSAQFNGNYRFHFDEALPKLGAWRGFVLTSWNEK